MHVGNRKKTLHFSLVNVMKFWGRCETNLLLNVIESESFCLFSRLSLSFETI